MLVRRLRELERNGVLVRAPKPAGQGSTYHLTPAGADLAAVLDDMADWADRWVDVRPEHTDPGFALWAWCRVQLDRSALPVERTVVGFTFPDQRPGSRRYWLLVADGDAQLCYRDPGGEPAVEVVAQSRAFIDWHRGALSWRQAIRRGEIEISGRRSLVRSFPSWNLRTPSVQHAERLDPDQSVAVVRD